MTNEQIEQIEQNAKNFAINETGGLAIKCYPCERGYIAGAHSRDKEIEELERKVSALETVIATARATISTQEAIVRDLRNPWISVNAKLPEVKKRVLFLCNNGRAYFGYNNIDNKGATVTNALDGVKVTHWMPIPEVPESNN